jgi:cell division protein FtsA
MNIKDVYVGIAGSHIKGFSSYGAVGIKGKEVTHEDVERAIDSASAVYVPLDREILHVLPTDFILDGQDGIKDPAGMAGVRLEVKVYIVTGAVASVQNLLKCCERAGLEVVDIVLQPLASAEATLTADERDMGIALVDIGGGTTDVAIYKDGWLRHTAVLGIGGNHLTNDISVGLRLPFNEAERVKKKYGSILPEANSASEVDVVAIDGQVRGIPKKYIAEIIQPRCEELLELIRQEMQMLHNSGIAISGVVLTGGSSLLTGFDRMAEAVLSMPVRIGYPQLFSQNFSERNTEAGFAARDVSGLNEFNNPMYATGIGLVFYGTESLNDEKGFFSSDIFNRIVSKMAGWFKRIVGSKR